MGTRPCVSPAILLSTLPMQTTSLPLSARQVPCTRPTYPVPTTATLMVDLLCSSGPILAGDHFREKARSRRWLMPVCGNLERWFVAKLRQESELADAGQLPAVWRHPLYGN